MTENPSAMPDHHEPTPPSDSANPLALPPVAATVLERPAYGSPPSAEAPLQGHWASAPRTAPVPTAAPTPITETERAWSVAAHLSGFVAAAFALGFVGPLTVWLVAGGTSPTVRRNAVEALNFNLSVLLYVAVSAVLLLVGVGFLLLPLVGLMYVVCSIKGAVAASQGRDYRYPLTVRLIS